MDNNTLPSFIRPFSTLALMVMISLLVACGGGGGGDSDTTPDAFSFASVVDVDLDVEVTSPTVTVSGINAAASISVTGGEYSINGGAFVSGAGQINNGDSVALRLSSSASFSTSVTATVTIGGVSGTYSVTTLAADTTPDAFTFTAVTDAELNTEYQTAAFNVSGINTNADISITGGEYAINSSGFVSAAGQVANGDAIVVRQTSSPETSTETIATLSIGGVSAEFSVTTFDDTEAPTASIVFPPPVSLTEGTSILVRGTASDNVGVASLSVNGVDAVTTDGFATWTADIPLVDGQSNNLVVTVIDASGNEDNNAAQAIIESDTSNPDRFPLSSSDFYFGAEIALDNSNGRNRILASSFFDGIIEVDLDTSERTTFIANGIGPVSEARGIFVDLGSDRAFVTDRGSLSVYEIALGSGDITPISDNTDAISMVDFDSPYGVVFDEGLNRLLIADRNIPAIITVDLTVGPNFGVREILSSNSFPPTNNSVYSSPSNIALDTDNDRAFVGDIDNSTIVEVSLDSGEAQIITDGTTPNSYPITVSLGSAIDVANNRLLYIDKNTIANGASIVSVNLLDGGDKGIRTVVSDFSTDDYNSIRRENDRGLVIDGSIAYVGGSLEIIAVDLITGKRVVIGRTPPP